MNNNEKLSVDSNPSKSRTMRILLPWLYNTLPGCQQETHKLAKVTEGLIQKEKELFIRRVNKSKR